jgi:hypothetical protein
MPFIAMEYVAGKTLDQLIGRNGLRLNDALKYSIQIADAPACVHSVDSSDATIDFWFSAERDAAAAK